MPPVTIFAWPTIIVACMATHFIVEYKAKKCLVLVILPPRTSSDKYSYDVHTVRTYTGRVPESILFSVVCLITARAGYRQRKLTGYRKQLKIVASSKLRAHGFSNILAGKGQKPLNLSFPLLQPTQAGLLPPFPLLVLLLSACYALKGTFQPKTTLCQLLCFLLPLYLHPRDEVWTDTELKHHS